MCIAFFLWEHPQLPDLQLVAMFNRDEVLGRWVLRRSRSPWAARRTLQAGMCGVRVGEAALHAARRQPCVFRTVNHLNLPTGRAEKARLLPPRLRSWPEGPRLPATFGGTSRASWGGATLWRAALGCASAGTAAPPSSPTSGRYGGVRLAC